MSGFFEVELCARMDIRDLHLELTYIVIFRDA
jgi:hypothetical protein